MREFKYLLDITRGTSDDQRESIFSLYRVLILKKAGLTKNDSPKSIYDAMLHETRELPNYQSNERIFYDVFMLFYDFTVEDCLDYISYVQSRFTRISDFFVVPEALTKIMFEEAENYKSVFIPDCEAFARAIYDLAKKNNDIKIFTSSRNITYLHLMKMLFDGLNVEFIDGNYYKDEFVLNKFDLVICFPIMGGRLLSEEKSFISRELAFIATQNLLCHITHEGELRIILPAKVAFAGGDIAHFRKFIEEYYKICEIDSLPNKLFYPYMSINTYLLSLRNGTTDEVIIKKYDLESEQLVVKPNKDKLLFSDEFAQLNGWSIETAFIEKDDALIKFEESSSRKDTLSDVADVFRGRAITEKNPNGNISVINISNITDLGIDYSNLDKIQVEERKVSRYLLENGDVLITSRGTLVKVAVFSSQSQPCIASSNINVVRTNKKVLLGEYLKLFLESDAGNCLLKSLQRGTTIVNINYQDILTLAVPVPPIKRQIELISKYKEGLNTYLEVVETAEQLWKKIKKEIQDELF